MGFFSFLTFNLFFHFIAFGLRPSVEAFKVFFCFSTRSFFFHFIAFGLRPSGLGFHGLSLFFDLQRLFPFCFL